MNDKPVHGEFHGEHGYTPGQLDDVMVELAEGQITEAEADAKVEQLVAPKLAPDRGVQQRYVAGLNLTPDGPRYSVWLLYEIGEWSHDGPPPTRVGNRNVIPELTTEQAEHLWMQLGKVLGKPEAFT